MTPLVLGLGLDRNAGPMTANPAFQEDLRNVYLADGLAYIRNGSRAPVELLDPDDDGLMTDVLAGELLKVTNVGVLVAWRESTREVHVFRVSGAGITPVHAGVWFTLAEGAVEPPRIFMAEVAGIMFLAHDEPSLSRRAPTVGYDPSSGALDPIEPAWAASGGIRFRGVAAHLGAYLAGWGYGTATETRPDLVRMSLPGDPTTFELRHYESIGQPGEAVLRCVSVGGTLLCLKAFEVWTHFGSDRRTFGKRQLEGGIGILSSRLGIVVDTEDAAQGLFYFWSHLGPRVSGGGPSSDMALPLALFNGGPEDLVAEGDSEAAFATYYPPRKQVRFHFGERYYAFDRTLEQWSYGEMGYTPSCAFHLSGNEGIPDPVTALEWEEGETTDELWSGVAYAPSLNRWAKVGFAGKIATSDDGGETWTIRASPSVRDWQTVCWSADLSLFVAIASDAGATAGMVITSPDGLVWTSRNAATANVWQSVVWAGGTIDKFVAVAQDGVGDGVMTSPDGIVWTTRVPATDTAWFSVCYSADLDLLVAVSGSGAGNRVMTSPNGTAWTTRVSAADRQWFSVTASDEFGFVAVATDGDTDDSVMVSADGITWALKDAPAAFATDGTQWAAVVWSEARQLFVALAQTGTVAKSCMVSPDGDVWSLRDVPSQHTWKALAVNDEGAGVFVAVGQSGSERVMHT